MEKKNIATKTKKRISKKDIAYEYIRTNIFNGNFGPGYRLIIDQIKKELNLSSIPVREAIQQLEAENIVQIIPYSGAVVKVIDKNEHAELQTLLAILDGAATAMAVEHLTEQDLKQLEEINKLMETALSEFRLEDVGHLNKAFHKSIYKKCGNTHLEEALTVAWDNMIRIRKSIYTFVPTRGMESISEHRKLLEMIRKHEKSDKIEKFCRQHKMKMIDAIKASIENKKQAKKLLGK